MIDSRGQEVHLCDRSSWPADLPRNIRRALGRAEMGSKRFAMSYAMSLVIGAPILVLATWFLRLPMFVAGAGLIGPTFLGIVIVGCQRIMRKGHEANARRAMLSVGRCPSCGYELRAAPLQPDGCTVCPECGAAWRLSRVEAAA